MRIAAIVRALVQAGASGEMILAAVEAAEAQAAAEIEARRANDAARQARRRERKANAAECHVTSRDVTVTGRDPSFLSLSPTPPNPNQTTTNPPPYSPPALKPDDVWQVVPRLGRERSSKRDLERAFGAAVKRGHAPEAILAGVKAYYASDDATKDGGQFAKGVHRIIENDRWQSYSPEDKPPDWENFLATWRATGRWPKSLGPPPDHPETLVPQALRAA